MNHCDLSAADCQALVRLKGSQQQKHGLPRRDSSEAKTLCSILCRFMKPAPETILDLQDRLQAALDITSPGQVAGSSIDGISFIVFIRWFLFLVFLFFLFIRCALPLFDLRPIFLPNMCSHTRTEN